MTALAVSGEIIFEFLFLGGHDDGGGRGLISIIPISIVIFFKEGGCHLSNGIAYSPKDGPCDCLGRHGSGVEMTFVPFDESLVVVVVAATAFHGLCP